MGFLAKDGPPHGGGARRSGNEQARDVRGEHRRESKASEETRIVIARQRDLPRYKAVLSSHKDFAQLIGERFRYRFCVIQLEGTGKRVQMLIAGSQDPHESDLRFDRHNVRTHLRKNGYELEDTILRVIDPASLNLTQAA